MKTSTLLPKGYDFRKSRTWQRVRLTVLRRDHGQCRYCGQPAVEVDHVVPASQGGSWWDPANLAASCRKCNAQRGNRARRSVARSVFRQGIVDIQPFTDNLHTQRLEPAISGDYSRRSAE